jgi:hypothetical protein
MPACCSTFESAAEQQFNEKKAVEELRRYRTTGPGRTTRLLREGIAHTGALNGTLLDVGSGVGSLLRKNSFRMFVHPVARMEQMIRQAGFDLCSQRETWMWSVDVYTRAHTRHRSRPQK